MCNSSCGCGHHHHHSHSPITLREGLGILFVIALLVLGKWVESKTATWGFPCYIMAYVSAGMNVFRATWQHFQKGSWFNEFSLMLIATLCAFALGEYLEAVAVLLFYQIGEIFQSHAVNRARRSIEALAALRPDQCMIVLPDGSRQACSPQEVEVGHTLWVERGGRVPLDGSLLTPQARFDTAALTGESTPRTLHAPDEVLAGMIVMDRGIQLLVKRPYGEDAISRILRMVEEAAAQKAPTERIITHLARIYTPIVLLIAALMATLPALFNLLQWVAIPNPQVWFYRALIFLVASCPCALVLSIPLSYFHGIGQASRKGILFKGSSYLDAVRHIDTVVFDKTGTLTEGTVVVADGIESGTAGAFTVENDRPKPTAGAAIAQLKKWGIRTIMLSGDYAHVVEPMAQNLGLDEYHAQLLPADKLAFVDQLIEQGHRVAFVGDGINDAPVLARATLGFAMGAKGSDAAVETADVVLSTDDPAAIPTAIRQSRSTHRLVLENILLAFGIKILILLLSAFGVVGMWGAVIADTGVVLLCVLNVVRSDGK